MKYAAVGPIAVHLPEKVETNAQLQAEFPEWDLELIYAKTGIARRHVAAPDQCASDLGVAAAQTLLERYGIKRSTIDFLIFCTQAPDYPLPTTACLMQHRLGLPTTAGAFDFNLGCSGYVYGLALADGLIRAGAARRILLVTAETYSKYIDARDRSLRTIFGDAGAATLIEAANEPSLTGFQFGTDGSGGDMLLTTRSGLRPRASALKPRHRHRWPSDLYMDGPSLISFSLTEVPKVVDRALEAAQLGREDVDWFLFHQATLKLLEQLLTYMNLDRERAPIMLKDYGNTVSCTLPIMIERLRREGRLQPGHRSVLVGFGVGLSWAACVWRETWRPGPAGRGGGTRE